MTGNRVVKNAAWIIACRVIQAVLALLVTMLSARYLQPAGYGLINYAASIVAFVAPIMQLGLNSILVQECVNNPEKEGETLGTALTMSFVSGAFCILGVIAFAYVSNPNEKQTIIVCALYGVLLVFQALSMMEYWFQAKLKSKYTSIVMLIAYAVTSAYKILLLVFGGHIYWFALSQALDYLLIAVALIILFKVLSKKKLTFSWAAAKRMFAKSKHYIVSSLMVTIFAQTDRIMIKQMIDVESTGYYSAAVACAGMSGFVFGAIIDSARPSIFESKKAESGDFERNVSRLYSVIIYLSLIQCVVITCCSPLIVKILYGGDYAPAVNPLRLIVWYTTFAYLGSVRNIWILAESKQKYLWILNLSGALMNVALNFIFIPIWGIMGAAFASLVTQIFTNVIMNVIVWPIRRNNLLMWKGLNPRLLVSMAKSFLSKK